mmetsp:Transcript_36843/g.69320  ORF Transcript_36843/g.69320 Transcript_36843/m.69320 type:complete len:100 (+) Transcript_36843:1715-2014(+)
MGDAMDMELHGSTHKFDGPVDVVQRRRTLTPSDKDSCFIRTCILLDSVQELGMRHLEEARVGYERHIALRTAMWALHVDGIFECWWYGAEQILGQSCRT